MLPARVRTCAATRHWPRNQNREGAGQSKRSGCPSQWSTVTFPGSRAVIKGQLASASSQHWAKAASAKEESRRPLGVEAFQTGAGPEFRDSRVSLAV